MPLSLDFYLQQQPGISRWLQRLNERGYITGAELVEGPYLTGNFDSAMVDTVLVLLEQAGQIRRGELRQSTSQLAFHSLGGCANIRGVDGSWPARCYAWYPHKDWIHPAFRANPPIAAESCDWCETGACWTHRK